MKSIKKKQITKLTTGLISQLDRLNKLSGISKLNNGNSTTKLKNNLKTTPMISSLTIDESFSERKKRLVKTYFSMTNHTKIVIGANIQGSKFMN